MAGSSSDLITKTTNGSRPVPTTVTGTRSAGGTTLACAALTGWETGTTGVHFATYRTDANNNVVAGSQCDWEGVVSGTNITNLVLKAGTDAGNSIGDVVAPIITAAWGDGMAQGILAEHTTAGLHVMARPKITTSIDDTNGNELIKFTSAASAVNEVTVSNTATGTSPLIASTGGDTNLDLRLNPKGTGRVVLNGAGAPQTATVATSETTTSTSYADLATTTDTVTATVGASGIVQVVVSMQFSNSGANVTYADFAVSGANTRSATDNTALIQGASSQSFAMSKVTVLTGLTAGSSTFKLKYRVSGGTGTYVNRSIAVIPL